MVSDSPHGTNLLPLSLSEKITEQVWRKDVMSETSIWIRCDLPNGESNVVVCHIGANHPPDVSNAIADDIVRSHNTKLKSKK